MNNDFFQALELLTLEKGIPADKMIEHIKIAVGVAVKKYYDVDDENVLVDVNQGRRNFQVSLLKDVVEKVSNPVKQLSLEEALERDRFAKLNMKIPIKLDMKQIGRIAALSGKNLIHQAINEVIKQQVYERYRSKIKEVIGATVQKIEPDTGNATLRIDKQETVLFAREQIPGEELKEGQQIKVYVNDIVVSERRTSIKVSRSHPQMVKRLFETEVPEIFDGTVEIKAVSREAGSRSKIAVMSHNPEIDPRGACIGQNGMRVEKIVNELCGEKIDVILYSEIPEEFIAQALAPAWVLEVHIPNPEIRVCAVKVPDHHLSLAIGNKGQNAKLAAKLTGYKIDIRPESEFNLSEITLEETKKTSDEPLESQASKELFLESPSE